MFRSILCSLALVAALCVARPAQTTCDYYEIDEGGNPYCGFTVSVWNNSGCSYDVFINDVNLPTGCRMWAACWCDDAQACNMSAAMDVDDSGIPGQGVSSNFVSLDWDCISSCGWNGEMRFWYENLPYYNCQCCNSCASPSYYMTAVCD